MRKTKLSQFITTIRENASRSSIIGLPINRYINIEESEQVLRACMPGGLVLATEQIALALLSHPAKVTVFVPHYAMSEGTMIALAADESNMDFNAVLGPVDPQLSQFPAVSILKAVSRKRIDRVDDNTLIMADMAEKAVRQVEDFLTDYPQPPQGRPSVQYIPLPYNKETFKKPL